VKYVILTLSHAGHRGQPQEVVRDTWRKDLMGNTPFNQKFILGRGNYHEGVDEWIVDAPDDYNGLWLKQREAYKRALSQEYDYVFLSCIDTYVVPFRMWSRRPFDQHIPSENFRYHYFTGRRCDNEQHAGGGNGYWIHAAPLRKLTHANWEAKPGEWSDQTDSRILLNLGYHLNHDNHYGVSYTKHLSKDTGVYDPQWMYDLHKQFMHERLP
jgi:hypothetical protein